MNFLRKHKIKILIISFILLIFLLYIFFKPFKEILSIIIISAIIAYILNPIKKYLINKKFLKEKIATLIIIIGIVILIIGVLLIFMVNPAKAAIFIVLFLVLQQIEGNLIYPHVVGNSVGLPSIWVLAAVSVGGSLMGITGMLIFIPIVSVLYALFREVVYLKLKKNKIDPGKIR